MGKAEPETALAWATSLSNPLERREALQLIMGTVSDVTERAKFLESLDLKGDLRKRAVNTLANNVVQLDLDGTLSWIETLTPNERQDILANHLCTISHRDPERAKQLFDENLSLKFRNVADNLGENLAKKDLQSAQAWVDSLPSGEIKEQAIGGVIKGLSSNDPKAAAAYLDSLGHSDRSSRHARNWFDQDQNAALAWIESQRDPNVSKKLTSEVLEHWSQQYPAAAMNHANKIDDRHQQIDAQRNILHYKTLKDSDRLSVLYGMIGAVATTDIDAAVDVLESSLASPVDLNSQQDLANAADNLVGTWAGFDAKAAVEWSASLSLPAARTQALHRAAAMWIRQDSLVAAAWIGELPAGPGRDVAVSRDDPSTAFTWANTLGDETQRSNELRNLLRRWSQTDPTAAIQALQSANLSDDAYNSLAKQLEQ